MTTQDRWQALSESMDEAVKGLTHFDAESLEALEQRLSAMTAEYRGLDLAECREMLPELLQKHTMLQEMLRATSSNLKVMAAVREARIRTHDGRMS